MTSHWGKRRFVLGMAVLWGIAAPLRATADPIPLTVDNTVSLQQIDNRPCVIGDPSCHNPDSLPYTLLGPQMKSGTVSSATYTVEQIRNVVGGDTFYVGLDLNQAPGHNDGTFNLLSFVLSVDGTVMFSTAGPSTILPINPGNGYSDAMIGAFDLSGFAPDARLVFTTTFAGGSAGREQYFLRPFLEGGGGVAPVPEPASMLLAGSGLVAAFLARRRRLLNERELPVSPSARVRMPPA